MGFFAMPKLFTVATIVNSDHISLLLTFDAGLHWRHLTVTVMDGMIISSIQFSSVQ